MPFTEIDIAVCVILSTSALIVFLLGGIRVLVGFAKWVGAAIITFLLFPQALEQTKGTFSNPMVGNVLLVVGLFVAALVICSIFAAGLMAAMGPFKRSLLDRLFGLVLGLAIGFYLVSVMHILFATAMAKDGKEPEKLTHGATYKLTKYGADMLKDKAGGIFEKILATLEENKKLTKEQAEGVKTKMKEMLNQEGKVIGEEVHEAGEKAAEEIKDSGHLTVSGPSDDEDTSGEKMAGEKKE